MSPRAATTTAKRTTTRARVSTKSTSKAPATRSASKAPAKRAAKTTTKPAAKSATRTTTRTTARTAAKAPARTPAKAAPKPRATAPAPATTKSRPASRSTGTAKARTRTAGHRRISAGEVEYSSNLFRSKLEMRWCAFFDLLGVCYDYEPCWYRVGPDLRYTPDIWLPGLGLWAEVKGPDYLDAASWAKIAAAVAGPAPLPGREHPYAPAERMLLLGPMDRDLTGDPAIGLVQRIEDGKAGIHRARIQGTGAQTEFIPDPEPLETVAATGVAATRRPVEKIRAKVLLPPAYPEATGSGASARTAYRAAARLRVDDTRRALARDNDESVLAVLGLRRGGRPLPSSPWPGT